MTGANYLGYESLISELSTLITTYPPPFLYVNDGTSPSLTSSLTSFLSSLANNSNSLDSLSTKRVYYAKVNATACFTPRLLYDSTLNFLAGWTPSWDDGCMNWGLEGDGARKERWNEHFDGFVHGLRAVSLYLGARQQEGKGKIQAYGGGEDVRLVILVERAERLKDNLPELIVPLTRLAELTQLDLTVIFLSEVRWEDIRPPLGAAVDPYFIDIPPLTKELIIQRVISIFPITTSADDSPTQSPGPYHPSLKSLYAHFISVLCEVCFPFSHDISEIQYIAAARWPGFVQPILDQHQRELDVEGIKDSGGQLIHPSEDVRMRLTRIFNASLSNALEDLYPRLTNATDWAAANKPEFDLLSKPPGYTLTMTSKYVNQGIPDSNANNKNRNQAGSENGTMMKALPRMSKFILVAAFLASTNPAKSDVRMFGRGLDEKKRKRRSRITTGGKTKTAKVPQRLVGPLAFPLDRLIAILGALLEENDAGVRMDKPEYVIPGEYTDMETKRVGVYSAIMELTSMRLLYPTSPQDRLDGPPMFKCGVSYETTSGLARQLGVPLNDLMWGPA